jgi:hypothetical protein
MMDDLENNFKTIMILVNELKPHPRNYRSHPEDQLEHIIKSIKEHGFYRNIVIARDNTILAGHGVVEASKRMGLKSVPVIRLDIAPDDPRALKVLIGDNEIEQLGEQDDRLLTELLKEVKDFDVDGLLGTGFDPMMLANLVFITRPESEIRTFDEAAEWIGMPGYESKADGISMIVHFANDADRMEFAKKLGLNFTEKTKFFWYPPRQEDDILSVRFVNEKK